MSSDRTTKWTYAHFSTDKRELGVDQIPWGLWINVSNSCERYWGAHWIIPTGLNLYSFWENIPLADICDSLYTGDTRDE